MIKRVVIEIGINETAVQRGYVLLIMIRMCCADFTNHDIYILCLTD